MSHQLHTEHYMSGHGNTFAPIMRDRELTLFTLFERKKYLYRCGSVVGLEGDGHECTIFEKLFPYKIRCEIVGPNVSAIQANMK